MRFLFNPVRERPRLWRAASAALGRLFSNGMNILFPPICLSCRKNLGKENASLFNKNLCADCAPKIEIASGFLCPKCLRRLPELKSAGWRTCHPETKFVLGAASSYQNAVVREIIHSLKYQKIKAAAGVLGQILFIYLSKILQNSDWNFENFLVIPIPLHPKKQKERGFNQSSLIAESLLEKMNPVRGRPAEGSATSTSSSLKALQSLNGLGRSASNGMNLLGLQTDNLVKTKNTQSQTQLQNFEEREQNVAASFALKNPASVKNKNIVLIDDVFTSGATMKEAVKVLKSAGAKKIIALVVARA